LHKDHFSSSASYSQTWHKYITRLMSRIAYLTHVQMNGESWTRLCCAVLCKEGTFFSIPFFVKQISFVALLELFIIDSL